jgi:hypothetical protein
MILKGIFLKQLITFFTVNPKDKYFFNDAIPIEQLPWQILCDLLNKSHDYTS